MILALIDFSEGQEMKFKAWSYSRLSTFEACKQHAKLQYLDKIPEPERPLPPGKTEHANDRGTRLHEAAEAFIRGGVELLPELSKHFAPEFERAKDLFKEGKLSLEGEWGFNAAWEPVAYFSNDVTCRIKADMVCHMSDDYAVVVDYKSGKKYGNEIKHSEQMRLYVIAVLLRNPNVKKVRAELWYLDQNELTSKEYTRDQGLRFLPNYERRGNEMLDCEDFPANPNAFSCRWCPYKPIDKGGTGHCPKGV